MGDFHKAITDYNYAIGLDPRSSAAYSIRGNFWTRTGEYDRAINDYQRALEINPDSPAIINHLRVAQAMQLGYQDFDVTLEADEDGWFASYPPWNDLGAATFGITRKIALSNIEEVLSMILEEIRDGEIHAEDIAARGGFPMDRTVDSDDSDARLCRVRFATPSAL